ncbi:hypothetical protein M422DRAFT_252811 [Sphaerobolus stellatus SS14]|uniref:DUF6532 domain-containing protein n=1 Tax=Sphaerobolus stellatus (strain SS14) TaxID=990650 RepID=A0A0C9VY29_SPHS4|nr:hypothetical protein M422DRAFT_252811 [Sphaerobolus stellatus SS14]
MPIANFASFQRHVRDCVAIAGSQGRTPVFNTTDTENQPPKRTRTRTQRGTIYDEELQQEQATQKQKSRRKRAKVVVSDGENPFELDEEQGIPKRLDYDLICRGGAFTSSNTSSSTSRSTRNPASTSNSGSMSEDAPREPQPASTQSSMGRFFSSSIDTNVSMRVSRSRTATRATTSDIPSTVSGGSGGSPDTNHGSTTTSGSSDRKRRREGNPPTKKASKKERTRPKLNDLDQPWLSIAELAIQDYSCKLATVSPFPNPVEEQVLANDALQRACFSIGHTITNEKVYQICKKLIIARDSHMCGELRDKLVPLIHEFYGFKDTSTEKGFHHNQELYDLLKTDNRLVFSDFKNQKGLYEGDIIQQAINAMWFFDSSRKKNHFTHYFNPIPLVTIALIFTVTEYIVNRWSSGSFKKGIPFCEQEYSDVYQRHLTNLEELKGRSNAHAAKLGRLQTRLYKRAIRQAKSVGVNDQPLLNDVNLDDFINTNDMDGQQDGGDDSDEDEDEDEEDQLEA